MKPESIANKKTSQKTVDSNSKGHVADRRPDPSLATVKNSPSQKNNNATVTQKKAQPVDKLASRSEMYIALLFISFYVAVYMAGRYYWDERYYIAEEGLGYYLGLFGGIIMLLAMIYSIFKYAPSLRKRIKIKTWLNVHIVFGLLGPLLIYLHSTFHIGSLNGGIALVSMSLVLLSGIIGRFLYSKTHYGLGGRKAKLSELHKLLNDENNHFHSHKLNKFTQNVMGHSASLIKATWELLSYPARCRLIYFSVSRELVHKLEAISQSKNLSKKESKKYRQDLKSNLWAYLMLLHKVALFKLYERFFAFWRNAHVPLLFLLLFSGIVHVIAVHMYSS